MKATELFNKNGKPAGIWFCGECRLVKRTQEEAEECCKPPICNHCGKEHNRKHWTICDSCDREKERTKEKAAFEKAEKITEWDGWVFLEGYGHNEGYFYNIEEFRDWFECEYEEDDPNRPDPEYLWTCKPEFFVKAYAGQIIEPICDDGWEDFDPDDLNGMAELEAAIDAFNKANEKVCKYQPDSSLAVLLSHE